MINGSILVQIDIIQRYFNIFIDKFFSGFANLRKLHSSQISVCS